MAKKAKDAPVVTQRYLDEFNKRMPPPTKIEWQHQTCSTFKNSSITEEEAPTPSGGKPAGLNKAYWHHLKDYGHDHDKPTKEEIEDPLWIFFHFMRQKWWRKMAKV